METRARRYEKAARLFLSGEMNSTQQIAAAVTVPPHTVSRWRREGSWDELKRGIPVKAAAILRQRLAGTHGQHLAQQMEILGLVLIQAGSHLASEDLALDDLKRIEKIMAASLRDLAMIRDDLTRAVTGQEKRRG